MTIDSKGAHYPKAVIVHAVFFYVRYAVILRRYWPSVVWLSITQP
jgi:transposase-like protein